MKAILKFAFPDKTTALSVSKALRPDNMNLAQGLRIETRLERNQLIATVFTNHDIGSLSFTLDDLIAGAIVAEASLKMIRKSRSE